MSWTTYSSSNDRNFLLPPSIVLNDPNPILPNDASYIGLFYAYEGSGGYVMEQGFEDIIVIPYEQINKYDLTQSLQVRYDVRTFNEKIGLFKDASNILIIDSSYDPVHNTFPVSEISLTASEFLLGMNPQQVIYVGKYHTLYSDFQTFLNEYFGYPQGFDSLFTIESQININGGVFDADALMNLMKYKALTASGEYVKTMTGTVTIQYVNALLRFANQYNPFNNRIAGTKDISGGFIEGDLIFIPTGTTVTLTTAVKNLDVMPNYIGLNASGDTHLDMITYDYSNGNFSQVTTVTNDLIKRVVKVPLLIKLSNLSTNNLYVPTTSVSVNFTLKLSITNPIPRLDGSFIISNRDQSVILKSLASMIGINTSSISLTQYNITLLTRSPNPPPISPSDFTTFRNSYRNNTTSPVLSTYKFDGNFFINATLGDINSSIYAFKQVNTPGDFVNNVIVALGMVRQIGTTITTIAASLVQLNGGTSSLIGCTAIQAGEITTISSTP